MPIVQPDLRARIAGELHDLVTHQVSVVTVQANAAHALLGRDPAGAAAALVAARATATEALADIARLRRVLGQARP